MFDKAFTFLNRAEVTIDFTLEGLEQTLYHPLKVTCLVERGKLADQ